MPNFCKPGLFHILVEDKIDQHKANKERTNQFLTEHEKAPYYVSMPKRFQEYEIYKLTKQALLKNRSLEDIDPNYTFQPAINNHKFGLDFKHYFSALQLKFQAKLQSQKNMYHPKLKLTAKNQNSAPFVSNFNKKTSKHFCLYKDFEQTGSSKIKKRCPTQSSSIPVLKETIWKTSDLRGRSGKDFHKECFDKNDSFDKNKPKEIGFIYNPLAEDNKNLGLDKILIEREELMDKDEFDACRFVRKIEL